MYVRARIAEGNQKTFLMCGYVDLGLCVSGWVCVGKIKW